nr:gfo/Idh/MocA family oxidoreductase [Verrucomicrobiota bacterium]
YPTAEEARITVAIVHAARLVRNLNFKYLRTGKGAPVTAHFGRRGITIVDPYRAGGRKGFQRVYSKPI